MRDFLEGSHVGRQTIATGRIKESRSNSQRINLESIKYNKTERKIWRCRVSTGRRNLEVHS